MLMGRIAADGMRLRKNCQEIQRQGFRDGIEGARKDSDNHRRPNVNNRDEYRHPMFHAVSEMLTVKAFAAVITSACLTSWETMTVVESAVPLTT